MTIQEMHYDFDVKIDKVASQTKENFNKAEKDWLLNEAILVYLKQKYGPINKYRAGFEGSQKRIDDLSSLHIKYPEQPGIQPIVHDEGTLEVPLSQLKYDYLFLTRGSVDVIYDSCTKRASLREIEVDDLNLTLMDPFNMSNDKEVIINFGKTFNAEGSSIYLYPDTLTLGKVYLEYIKYPAKVNFGGYTYLDGVTYPAQDCDLPEHTHPEIVDLAVAIASEEMKHPNYTALKQQKYFNLSE